MSNLIKFQSGQQMADLGGTIDFKISRTLGGILIQEAFTDTDGTLLPAHIIAPKNTPGTSWTSRNGTWWIASNVAEMSTNISNGIATCVPGIANGTFSVRCRSSSSGVSTAADVGIVSRFTGLNNYWHVGINPGADLFRIVETNNSVVVERAAASVTINPATWYTIIVVLLGTTIVATLDGGNEISYGLATLNQAVTTHGIRASTRYTDELDDYMVST